MKDAVTRAFETCRERDRDKCARRRYLLSLILLPSLQRIRLSVCTSLITIAHQVRCTSPRGEIYHLSSRKKKQTRALSLSLSHFNSSTYLSYKIFINCFFLSSTACVYVPVSSWRARVPVTFRSVLSLLLVVVVVVVARETEHRANYVLLVSPFASPRLPLFPSVALSLPPDAVCAPLDIYIYVCMSVYVCVYIYITLPPLLLHHRPEQKRKSMKEKYRCARKPAFMHNA